MLYNIDEVIQKVQSNYIQTINSYVEISKECKKFFLFKTNYFISFQIYNRFIDKLSKNVWSILRQITIYKKWQAIKKWRLNPKFVFLYGKL